MEKKLPHIYTFLWLLYYQQDGTSVSRVVLVLLLLISFYYWGHAMMRYKLPTPLKILAPLVIVWTFYGLIPMLQGSGFNTFYISDTRSYIQPFTEIKGICISILPIYAYYVFAKKGYITLKSLQIWSIIFFIFAIYTFISSRNALMLKYDSDEVINNASYVVVSLLTLIPLYARKPILQYVLMIVCMMLVLMGFKRGAIIIGVLSSLWIVYTSIRTGTSLHDESPRSSKVIRWVMVFLFLIASVYMVRYQLETSDFFNRRLTNTLEGDASGREDLFSLYYNHFIHETSLLKFLFGNGVYGTLQIGGNFAHNDWLEIAVDYGLLSLIMYFSFWVSLMVTFLRGKRGVHTTYILGLFFIIYFFKTFFSMSYNNFSLYAACALGYAFANYVSKRGNQHI